MVNVGNRIRLNSSAVGINNDNDVEVWWSHVDHESAREAQAGRYRGNRKGVEENKTTKDSNDRVLFEQVVFTAKDQVGMKRDRGREGRWVGDCR